MLFAWHAMLLRGRRDLKEVGCYRTSEEPMQVVSCAIHAPKVHFEATAAAAVAEEMSRFVAWFNLSPAVEIGPRDLKDCNLERWRVGR